jgi:hypothetical protein
MKKIFLFPVFLGLYQKGVPAASGKPSDIFTINLRHATNEI